MKITNIQPYNSPIGISGTKGTEGNSSFGSMLNQYIQKADAVVKNSEQQSILLAQGENVNLHDITIASQKASVALQLTAQIRNKAVEAYQEIMRMQV